MSKALAVLNAEVLALFWQNVGTWQWQSTRCSSDVAGVCGRERHKERIRENKMERRRKTSAVPSIVICIAPVTCQSALMVLACYKSPLVSQQLSGTSPNANYGGFGHCKHDWKIFKIMLKIETQTVTTLKVTK